MQSISIIGIFIGHITCLLEIVRKGDIVGKRNHGKLIVARDERVMILPKYNPPVGKEWFYLGYYKK